MSGQWGDFKSCKALLDRVERNDPSLTSLNMLPMKTFGDVELNRLAKIISSGINNHLLTFHASGHVVSYDCLEQFGFALSHASENNQLVLTDIAFGDKNMSDEGIASFAKGLRSSGSIVGFSKIDLSSKSLSAISWNLFIQSIYSLGDHSSMSSLRYLNIADNDLSGLKSSTKNDAKHQVESLNLARCNLKADDAQELLSFLLASQSSSIELIMSDNTLIGPSIRVLASAICKEKGKIRTLKLDGCGICDEQLEGLLYLGIGPQLQCVDLSRNRFETSSGISALASALSTSSVNDVVLSRNTIFEDSAKLLASALSGEIGCVSINELIWIFTSLTYFRLQIYSGDLLCKILRSCRDKFMQ